MDIPPRSPPCKERLNPEWKYTGRLYWLHSKEMKEKSSFAKGVNLETELDSGCKLPREERL
jgi:hypothetical protein